MPGEGVAGGVPRPRPAGEDAAHISGDRAELNGGRVDNDLVHGATLRPAFSFRRDLEFVRAAESSKRLGCETELWPRAVLVELISNALDALEEAGTDRPEIRIYIHADAIEVADNGPGVPPELVVRLCDRDLRTSAREAYPIPSRGRQGNALGVLLCLALGLGGDRVEHVIVSRGVLHKIVLTVDRLAQRIVVERQETPVEDRGGTTIQIGFPLEEVQIGHLHQLRDLVLDFAALNPHAAFTLRDRTGFDDDAIIGHLAIESSTDCLEKWPAAAPIPPHWYSSAEAFEHRILLELNHDPEVTVAQFLGTFKGLTSTQRRAAVAAAAGLTGAKLNALLAGRSIDTGRAGLLLEEMQGASRPPKAAVLGGLGKNCVEALANSYGDRSCPADFTYLVIEGDRPTPWRWEIGFAELAGLRARASYVGHNFAPLVAEDVFLRSLPLPPQLRSDLAPVFILLHRIAVDPHTLDYGKSHPVLSAAERTDLEGAIRKAAKRYLDRLEREQADRIHRMLQAAQRKADDRNAEKAKSILPWRLPGRQTPEAKTRYAAALKVFCDKIGDIQAKSDIEVSSRGWCYLLEEHGLRKGDFDTAQELINDCRKSGLLPLDICVEDSRRLAENLEDIDPETSPDDMADTIIDALAARHHHWTPFSFWEDQATYVEVLVEKIDLKSLFGDVCAEFCIPITNAGGWTDLNSRAAMMRRFKHWEAKGRKCVLLYCGDHDPGGLQISTQLRSNLAELSRAVDWSPEGLTIERFGLDADFIDEQGLTWIDNLRTAKKKPPNDLADPAHPDHRKCYVQDYLQQFGAKKCEANALVVRPAAARELCLEAITRHLPADVPRAYQRKLAPPREVLRLAIVDRLLGRGRQP